jgi:hypothetical protein
LTFALEESKKTKFDATSPNRSGIRAKKSTILSQKLLQINTSEEIITFPSGRPERAR